MKRSDHARPAQQPLLDPAMTRVPAVYLGWANMRFLAFFAFNGINNLRIFSAAFSSIPTAPTKVFCFQSIRSSRTVESEQVRFPGAPFDSAKSGSFKDLCFPWGICKQRSRTGIPTAS